MPFGESFLRTIKNNKSIMLDKSRRFRKTPGSFDWSESQQFKFKKTTPEQLEKIRASLKQEHRKIRNRQVFVFCLVMLTVISILIYLIH